MEDISALIERIVDVIINPLLALLFALALIFFLWGVAEFLFKFDEKRNEGKQHMIWGIFGMFIMVSAFAIIRLLLNTFNISLPS